MRTFLRSPWVATVGFFLLGCAAPDMDIETPDGREAILFEARQAIGNGECNRAVELIEPLYNSKYSNEEVRYVRASAHACMAGVKFFSVLTGLTTASSDLCDETSCSGFWKMITSLFYIGKLDTEGIDFQLDNRVHAGWLATDAIQSMISEEVRVPIDRQTSPGTFNVGSLEASDRTFDSNLMMVMVSLGLMGAIQNRYGQREGAPFPSDYRRTAILPWATVDEVDEVGCAYGGALFNFIDSLSEVSSVFSSVPISTGGIATALDDSCTLLCSVAKGAGGCGIPAEYCLGGCSAKVKTHTACEENPDTYDDDLARCAAMAVTTLVNSGPPLGWNCSGVCL